MPNPLAVQNNDHHQRFHFNLSKLFAVVAVCAVVTGNFHFGFVGAAAAIPAAILHVAAGQAQKRAGTSSPDFWCTHGDDPEDYEFIHLGIQLFRNVGTKVTSTSLQTVLTAFNAPVCK